MATRAVLWDIDDTIFDYASAARRGMHVHLEAEGLPGAYASMEQALTTWDELTAYHWARFAAGRPTGRGSGATGCAPSSAPS